MRTRLARLLLIAAAALATAGASGAQPPAAPVWLEASGPTLVLATDADPERAVELVTDLERFRAVFARLAPEIDLTSPVPTRLVAFRDAASFAPYKGVREGGGVRIQGYFTTGADGSFLVMNADRHETGALGVVVHESVHELVRHNFPWAPLWLHEGLAEYYSTFGVAAGRAEIGRPPARHLAWLERGQELDLATVLGTSRDTFRHDDSAGVGRFYAVSWLLTHYLLSGDPERLQKTAHYLALLAEGEGQAAAFEDAFEVPVRRLEEELAAYAAAARYPSIAVPLAGLPSERDVSVRRLPPADARVLLGDLSAQVGRPDLARELYHQALERTAAHPEALSGLAALEDAAGSLGEAEVLHAQAFDSERLSARGHLRYGRHLFLRVQATRSQDEREPLSERARTVLARAAALEPDNALVAAALGRAHLLPPADPAAGLAPLERAFRALPERTGWAFDLVQLSVRAGRFDLARAWVEGVLRRWADPEMLGRAEEELERGELLHAAEQAWEDGELEQAVELYDRAVSATRDPDLRRQMEAHLSSLRRDATATALP